MKSANIRILNWDLFKDNFIQTGITTRINGLSNSPYSSLNLAKHTGDNFNTVDRNRLLLIDHLGCDYNKYTHGNQIHSDIIHIVDNNNIGLNTFSCDALITKEVDVLLNIFVADCVPIVIFDPINRVGALCHCGWKGTYKKLLIKTISKLVDNYNSSIPDLLIGIGPSIGGCCYNVSEDLYTKFAPTTGEGYIKNKKYYLDLKEINKNQSLNIGIINSNIEVMNICTSCNNDMFFSFRKEGEPSGRFSCYLNIISS
ncbi:MAG: peptidoglycan editing factor PgeF [Spirochaetaceae bacterium]